MLYDTILYYTILYNIVLYDTIFYYTALDHTIRRYILSCYTLLYVRCWFRISGLGPTLQVPPWCWGSTVGAETITNNIVTPVRSTLYHAYMSYSLNSLKGVI